MNVKFRALCPSDLLTVRQHMPYAATESTRGIVAYDMDTAETLAVFLMDSWTKTAAQVHQVILKTFVIRHGWFEEIARFMYGTAGRKKVYATVPDTHARALSLNEKIGFEQVARLSDAWDEGVDYLVLEMTRENCKYWVPDKLRLVS
jgi:hypothetical protein